MAFYENRFYSKPYLYSARRHIFLLQKKKKRRQIDAVSAARCSRVFAYHAQLTFVKTTI
jgi:hypothetical protein